MRIVWSPQRGPQHCLIDCPLPEIFYGGARGGGKTDGILGKFALKDALYGKRFNAVFFRKEMPQQDDLIERAKSIYEPLGAVWHEQKKSFAMPGGGKVRFRPLESISDAEKYQGQNLTDAAVEEAGNYPASAPIDRLFGCLRSAHGVPAQLMLTANPGGPGHGWIKNRYIDPAPLGMKILSRKLPNGRDHRYIFIPAKLRDNRILSEQDPDYETRLYLVGSAQLVKAWLEGDWSAIEGAYFPEFDTNQHVIQPVELPKRWMRFKAIDWGSAKPFAVYWFAVSDGDLREQPYGDVPRGTNPFLFPKGALVVYREWYGVRKNDAGGFEPNVGMKLTAEGLAQGIVSRENKNETLYTRIDPSAMAEDGGPSIAERMGKEGVHCLPADNRRVARLGAIGGWDQVRQRLLGEDGRPMLYMFSTCTHLIRTLPIMQHDETNAEDMDSDGEDHACDALRYGCMSRPWTGPKPRAGELPRGAKTIKEMVDRHESRQNEVSRI